VEYGGSGVTLGWETGEKTRGTTPSNAACTAKNGVCDRAGTHSDFAAPPGSFRFTTDVRPGALPGHAGGLAPYLFRGKLSGFLTRLSATGLANVTSGGGQVPAFRVFPHAASVAEA